MRVDLVTCTHRPDAERFRLLAASVDRWVDADLHHHVIIPRRDRALFEPLASDRRTFHAVQDTYPGMIFQVPTVEKMWLQPFGAPIRGWILQQLLKLSTPNITDADAVVFVDSDIVFVKPFKASHVVDGDQVRLYRRVGEGRGPRHTVWHQRAAKLLGLPDTDYFGADYIGPLATWRMDVTRKLWSRLDELGTPWHRTMGRQLDFAEYILYGVFAEHVLGESNGHFFDDQMPCLCSWHFQTRDSREAMDIDNFLGVAEDSHVAVLIQSNLGIDLRTYREALIRLADLDPQIAQ